MTAELRVGPGFGEIAPLLDAVDDEKAAHLGYRARNELRFVSIGGGGIVRRDGGARDEDVFLRVDGNGRGFPNNGS
jgi:hypothetical protein